MARTASAPTSGQIDYAREGYRLTWDSKGLEVRSTDYHATQLRLSWEELLDLARKAGWTPDERERGPRS